MKTIPFFKMVASGNDFIVVDNRKNLIRNPKSFAHAFCRFHYGVGADGLLLIEKSSHADFFLRIINSDGSEAETCGNGFRCAAFFAHKILGFPAKMMFETLAGKISANIVKQFSGQGSCRVCVKMADPHDYRPQVALRGLEKELKKLKGFHGTGFVNTGVPHTVLFLDEINQVPVQVLGGVIRYHKEFAPRGTNVNFAKVTGPKKIEIRTYERGVEGETLACGSGSTAAAYIGILRGRVKPPVQVKTKGGEVLVIDLKYTNRGRPELTLEGNAEFVFRGNIECL